MEERRHARLAATPRSPDRILRNFRLLGAPKAR